MQIKYCRLPDEISELFWFVKNLTSLDDLQIRQAMRRIESFRGYLKSQYNDLYPNAKPCTSEKIGNHVFSLEYDSSNIVAKAKYEFAGLITTLDRSLNDFKELVKRENFLLSVHELKLIGAYAADSVEVIEHVFLSKGNNIKYEFSRRNVLNSVEPFRLSRYILGGLAADELENRAASVFLIRQALELRIKNALGVHSFEGEGTLNKVSGFIFVRILEENKHEIALPFDFIIFKKIVDWANASIHSGWVPPAWKIDWAHNYLEPLFMPISNKRTYSLFGAIKVKKTFLDNIQVVVQDYLRSQDKKIQENIANDSHVRPDKYDGLKIIPKIPESILLDD